MGHEELDELMVEEAHAHVRSRAGPLIRGRLIRVSEDEHTLLITMHHIVSDGWSMGVLLRELSMLYERISAWGGRPVAAAELGAVRRLCGLAAGVAAGRSAGAAGAYWREQLAGCRRRWNCRPIGRGRRVQASRGAATAGALQRVDRRAEGAEPAGRTRRCS